MLKPLANLTRTVRVVLLLGIGLTVPWMLFEVWAYFDYRGIDPSTLDEAPLLASDIFGLGLTVVRVSLMIVLVVVFLMWVYRGIKNLTVLTGEKLSPGPGWAVGSFFVPVFSLVVPYLGVKTLWEAAHRGAEKPSLVGWWWGLFLVSNLVSNIAGQIDLAASVSSQGLATVVALASDGLDMAAGLLALAVVTRIGEAYARNFGDGMLQPVPVASAELEHRAALPPER